MSDEKISFLWISNAEIKWERRNEDAGCEMNIGVGLKKGKNIHVDIFDSGLHA